MRQTLAPACIMLLLFCSHLKAMNEPCHAASLPEELIIQLVSKSTANIGQIIIFSYVCSAWNKALNSETFWKVIYSKRRGVDEKLLAAMSYKKNCLTPLLICHNAENCRVAQYLDASYGNNIIHQEITTNMNVPHSEMEKTFSLALNQKPQVFCSAFGPFALDSEQNPDLVNRLQQALSEDVLLIFPVGKSLASEKMAIEDLSKAYPHVIWSSACSNDGIIKIWPNCDNSGQFGVVSKFGGATSSAIALGIFATYLRSLRPGMSATKIRDLIFSAANKKTDGIFCEGILDREATIKAVQEWSGLPNPTVEN